MIHGPTRESETLASIRQLLLAALAVGVIGTVGELILLRHFYKPAQWIPLVAQVLLNACVPLMVHAFEGNMAVLVTWNHRRVLLRTEEAPHGSVAATRGGDSK